MTILPQLRSTNTLLCPCPTHPPATACSSCSGAVLNRGRSKDALNQYLTDRNAIKACGGGINSRDGACDSTMSVNPSDICNGFSLPFLTGDSKSPDTNWAGRTIGLFDAWEAAHRETVDNGRYWQPNTDVCTRDTRTSAQIDGLDNPYYVRGLTCAAFLGHRMHGCCVHVLAVRAWPAGH